MEVDYHWGEKTDCPIIALTPPFYPCVCARRNCICRCHGPRRRPLKLELPPDPDQFRTTNKDYLKKPNDDDYDPGIAYRPRDNLSQDPNLQPLQTENQREYTPKWADRPKIQKPGPWKYGKPIIPNTIQRDHYKPPGPDDYPDRVKHPPTKLKSGPGDYHTTNRDTYVRPTPDPSSRRQYPERKPKEPLPGLWNTEYNDKYLGDPTDPAEPFRQEPTPFGARPRDFKTSNDVYKPPSPDDYPDRERGPKKDPYHGPWPRKASTYTEDYPKPDEEEPMRPVKPKDTPLLIGPNGEWLSETHDAHRPKKSFCCPCAVR